MRHERALEVIVGLLVGAAGVSAIIGVYEATSHRSAAGWWTAAAGCLVAAGFLVVMWLGVHPLFVWGRGWTAGWRERAAAQKHRGLTQHSVAPREAANPDIIEVLHASYAGPSGFDDQLVDVLHRLRTDGGRRLSFQVTNEVLGDGNQRYDPAPNEAKKLTITYLCRGAQNTITVDEHGVVDLP